MYVKCVSMEDAWKMFQKRRWSPGCMWSRRLHALARSMFNRVEEKIERNLLISTSTLAERNQWRNSATSLDAVILGTCVAVEPENAEEVQEWMGPRSDQNLFFGHFYGDHWMCARIFNEEWMCRWWDDWIWLQRALSKPPPCSRIYHMWFLGFLWIRLRICYAACNSMWNFCVHGEEMLQERFVYM